LRGCCSLEHPRQRSICVYERKPVRLCGTPVEPVLPAASPLTGLVRMCALFPFYVRRNGVREPLRIRASPHTVVTSWRQAAVPLGLETPDGGERDRHAAGAAPRTDEE